MLAANDPLVLCLDKWTNDHDEKLIGVFVFQKRKKIFLGLENYDSKCPATYMKDRIIEILQKFGNGNFDRFICVMSDCGLDVVKFCNLFKVPHLPCLAHVLNIFAKKLIGIDADFSVLEGDETGDELDDIFALGVSGEVKTAVKDLKKPSILQDFLAIQKIKQPELKSPLKPLLANATRCNSTYLMLNRFLVLLTSITAFTQNSYNWDEIKKLRDLLHPLYEVTMKLNCGIEKSAHPFDFYVQCVDYIRSYLQQEKSLTDVRNPDVMQLLNRWCGTNNVVIQAFKKSDPLYDKLIGMVSDVDNSPNSRADDHPYTANLNNSFDAYLAKQGNCPVDQLVTSIFADIPGSNSDLERFFSYAKFLKTSFQSRKDPENFTRNVFLKMTEELNLVVSMNTAAPKVLTPIVIDN